MERDHQNSFVYYKRNLPHIQYRDNPVFITWRLAFALPTSFTDDCKENRRIHECELKSLKEEDKPEMLLRFDKYIFDKYDILMGQDANLPQPLRNSKLSEHIKSTLHHDDNKLYELLCYCIMPNHVHVLVKPKPDTNGDFNLIPSLLKSWKGVSARLINKELSRTGTVWQDESYDHVVRNDIELNNIVMYILNNPVKAGLVNDWREWESTYVSERLMQLE